MQRIGPALLIGVALLAAACSPAKPPAVAPAEAPHSTAPLPHPVTRPPDPSHSYILPTAPVKVPKVNGGEGWWSVPDIAYGDYLWRADGGALAFQTADGIWSVTADGQQTTQLIPAPNAPQGGAWRRLLRFDPDGVLYLEQGETGITVARTRAGAAPAVLLAIPKAPQAPALVTWYRVAGDTLLLLVGGQPMRAVNLLTGSTRQYELEPLDVMNGELAWSTSRRYLTYKLANRGDALRIIDLETGTEAQSGTEANLTGVAWSPAADRWAVRAAEPGSGQPQPVGANAVEGATHVDVGDTAGHVTHFHPPEPAVLIAGPVWSPDGARLAVLTNPAPTVDGRAIANVIWVLDVDKGTWVPHPTPEAVWLTGWAPDGQALEVNGSAGPALLPLSGDTPELQPRPLEQVTLPDGTEVAVVGDGALTVRRPGQARTTIMGPDGNLRSGLAVRGQRVAFMITGVGRLPELMVIDL